MATLTTPITQNPAPSEAYKAAYDALNTAYWEATNLDVKDRIHAAMDEVYDILTAADEQELTDNTQGFQALQPQIVQANKALTAIQNDINNVTKKIGTAAAVTAAIAKVLALFPL